MSKGIYEVKLSKNQDGTKYFQKVLYFSATFVILSRGSKSKVANNYILQGLLLSILCKAAEQREK